MFQNYLKIAIRNLLRHKTISFIHLFGLAIGLATCMAILLFIQHELSYDRFNEKAGRIVRVTFGGTVQGEVMNESSVMPPVAAALKADYPEVEESTRLRDYGFPPIKMGKEIFRDNSFAYVDGNFFSVFTLPFIEGDPATALEEPNTVVLSEATAAKLFGDENPMGKVLQFRDWKAGYKVTGVIKDIPDNSHFRFGLLASMTSLPEASLPTWMQSNFYTYLVLQKGFDYKKLEARLPQVVEKYIGPQIQEAMGMTLAQFQEKGNNLTFRLQRLTDIHLYSNFPNDLSPHGDVRYVWIFGAIAAFMLLIACINFMNLSTAGASKRAREVGIRKVAGSGKGELVKQFLLESTLMATIAMVLAATLVGIALPFLEEITGFSLQIRWDSMPFLLPGLLLFALLTGLLAGSYPAFFLSSFQPSAVLKGSRPTQKGQGFNSAGLRSGLVVFQFILSVSMIISTTVVYQQLQFIQNTKLGYNKDAVLILPNLGALGQKEEAFRQQLRQDPRVLSFSTSGYLPAGPTNSNNFFLFADNNETEMVKTLRYDVDEQYIPTLGLEMEEGRNFSKDLLADSAGIIINQAAATAFGWGEEPLGHTLKTTLRSNGEQKTYQVIGVVRDFHFRSLHERISPLVMVLGNYSSPAILKVETTNTPALLSSLKESWGSLTEEPFSYSFLDDRVYATYKAERTFGLILGIFTGLTIFVSCLGLFGLAIFSAEQRTKEIGIRKVLGATTAGIVGLLSKDFLKLVGIALVIASPLAYFFMEKWLADFAYRIEISWWVFALAGFTAVAVAFLTIGFQSVKAALANPVESLRNE